jgi:hypothetical protein
MLVCASTAHAAEFDREAAKQALDKIHVKHCGNGGVGEVRVTFGNDGFVSDVEVYDGKYTDNAMRCLERMFRNAVVLSFEGEPQTIKHRIVLPLEREAPVAKASAVVVRDYDFKYVNPKKWRSGDPVPPGYRVEETPRYGLMFAGMVVGMIGGVIVLAANTKQGSNNDPGMNMSSLATVYGGAILLGGITMTLIGLGTSRTELVPKTATF